MRAALVLLSALLMLAWTAPALAQAARPAASQTLAQAERNAVRLKQGMSAEEVEKLLGTPRRTALKNGQGSSSNAQGTLQWSYSWGGPSSQGSLQVEFAAKAPEAWYVSSWEWATY